MLTGSNVLTTQYPCTLPVVAGGLATLCWVSKCAARQTRCYRRIREGRWAGAKSFLSSYITVSSASAAWSSWWCTQGAAAATACHW